MKIEILVFLSTFLILTGSNAATNDSSNITIDQLRSMKVIGDLGVPLGTFVQIKAEIIDGDSFGTKGYSGEFLLKILSVNDKAMSRQLMMSFYPSVSAHKLPVANDHFSLYKLKYGKEASQLTRSQIEELKKDYVGKEFEFLAYETGRFSGTPNGLTDLSLLWQDTSFRFHSYISVLKEAEDRN